MIWLRILCDAIGRMTWFAFGGLLCGMIGGAITGVVLVPLFVLATYSLMPITSAAFMRNLQSSFVGGAMAGSLAGGAIGCLAMGITGLVQGLSPRHLSIDDGFNRSFRGMFLTGFWCLLAGFFSGVILVGLFSTVRGSPIVLFYAGFRLWVLFCYFGGSLLGALAPDALGNFRKRIKSTISVKPNTLPEKQNGVED